MADPNDLPPPRALPPAVRAEARQRLGEGLADRPARNGRTVVIATGVAAAVAATAVGVPLLTGARTAAPTGDVPAAASSPALPDNIPPSGMVARYDIRAGASAENVARCRADGWKPLFTASARGVGVVTFQSGDERRFCELTPETVALSAPAARPATGARISYVSASGTVAGVVAEGVPEVGVQDRQLLEPAGDQGEPAEVRQGAFVLPNTVTARPSSLSLHVGPAVTALEATDMPAAVSPRRDRPQPAHSGFGQCADRDSAPPLVDAHAWRPAAAVTLTSTERLLTARYAGLLAICRTVQASGGPATARLTVTDGHTPAGSVTTEAEKNPFLVTHGLFYDFAAQTDGSSSSDTMAIAGLVTDARVARVTLEGAARPVTATVDDGTFVLPGVRGGRSLTLTVTDAGGGTLGTVRLGG